MAPAFSKIPVAPLPGIPLISGLKCSHLGCFALFSNLEHSEAHAAATHAGREAAVSCGIYECQLTNGGVRLYRVLDEDEASNESEEKTTADMKAVPCSIYERRLKNGEVELCRVLDEKDENDNRCGEKTPNGEKNECPTNPNMRDPVLESSTSSFSSNFFALDDSIKGQVGKVVAISRAASEHQLETGEIELRVLDRDDESENESRETTRPTPISNPLDTNGENAFGTQLETRFVRASTLLPSTNSPSQSQSHHPAQPPSRQSTLSSISSFSSEDGGDDTNLKLNRIFSMVQEVVHERCRICWVEGTRSHPHSTFRCPKALCSGSEWNLFKTDLRFPPGKVCYFCMAPYCPPFNHGQPPTGVRRTADLCDYPDVLKELSYILYAKQSLREKVFGRLGRTMPQNLVAYKRYIASRPNGGTFGAYNVIYAYLEIREEEKALAQ